MRNYLVVISLAFTMLISSCGYHLVGQGDGAGVIEQGGEVIILPAAGLSASWYAELQRQLGRDYQLVDVNQKDAGAYRVKLSGASEQLNPVAYDASGIAVQYQLVLSASMQVIRGSEIVWESSAVAVAGDIYASGGPVEIASQREKVAAELYREWTRKMLTHMRSGF